MNLIELPKQISNDNIINLSKNQDNRIGCGWCVFEEKCVLRDPKVNQAKAGCEIFHYDIRAGKL